MTHVAIVGAGLIGCASALELARRGLRVTVLERGVFGRLAASRAAAGILGAQLEQHATAQMLELCVASRERYEGWIRRIEQASGRSVGYRRSGSMRVALGEAERDELAAQVKAHRAAGLEAEIVDGDGARRVEPALSDAVMGAALFPRDGIIDPPAMLEAVRLAAEAAGAQFRTGVEVAGLVVGDAVTGVRLAEGGAETTLDADHVVVAAGSWSTLLGDLQRLGIEPDTVRPARGQMLELRTERAPVRRVVSAPRVYLSPREDGRILVGSTVELVGHERAVTAEAARDLLDGALALVPSLAGARLTDSWCGFRALTPDRLPILDRGPREGLVLATGHFRNGIVLAPLTGEVVADLVLGQTPRIDLTPFSVGRFVAGARESP